MILYRTSFPRQANDSVQYSFLTKPPCAAKVFKAQPSFGTGSSAAVLSRGVGGQRSSIMSVAKMLVFHVALAAVAAAAAT